MTRCSTPGSLHVAVLLSGIGGLTWEVLWQHHASLALGVSAYGAAVTLAALMLGMGLGGLWVAGLARRGRLKRPLRLYGLCELSIGVGGLLVTPASRGLEVLDAHAYAASPALSAALQVGGIALMLLIPSAAMGATLPLLADPARRSGTSLSLLYALNLSGALGGVLLATFAVLPRVGVAASSWLAAGINAAVAVWALTRGGADAPTSSPSVCDAAASRPDPRALSVAFASAFVVFALEVSWFRSLRAAFQATTETFAIVVGAFLLSLAAGGVLATLLRRIFPGGLPALIALGSLAVALVTPHVDQIDHGVVRASELLVAPQARFLLALRWVFVPVALLGTWFPWVLADHGTPEGAGRLYACNTLGAVLGSLSAGFALLPWLGASATSFVAAGVGLALALWQLRGPVPRALALLGAGVTALSASLTHDGGARARVQGFQSHRYGPALFTSEGPDTTVWVAPDRRDSGRLALIIDGFEAAGEGLGTEYMAWMGHLPAAFAPRVRDALVICFGTGQTANALARHAEALTIVDVNPAVFRSGHLFASNQNVLERAGVEHVVMDGRAYLRRRPERRFDVITLEPLPPNFSGANHLYSTEFYELARSRLTPAGTAAQWVPFHLLAPAHVRSVVAAFVQVFPHARLWVSHHGTGILVGSRRPLSLRTIDAPLSGLEIAEAFALDAAGLKALAGDAPPVTDDNQLLAYGLARFQRGRGRTTRAAEALSSQNLAIVQGLQARAGPLRRAVR